MRQPQAQQSKKKISEFTAAKKCYPMTLRELQKHKLLPKKLKHAPEFRPQKRNKLPKPFNKLGGQRIHTTGIMGVSDKHVVLMCWRDGEILTDSAFFGYFYYRLMSGGLSPLFEFHWHPSHKGFHCKMPCMTDNNYANRFLAGAPEMNLKAINLDPRVHENRLRLILIFCELCGISPLDSDPTSESLFLK
jgi:hypothetical protein